MGARQYDPVSGRFLSVDPLFESFVNYTPYHYAYNNPISFKDPTGLAPEEEQGEDIAGEKVETDEVQSKEDKPDEIQMIILDIPLESWAVDMGLVTELEGAWPAFQGSMNNLFNFIENILGGGGSVAGNSHNYSGIGTSASSGESSSSSTGARIGENSGGLISWFSNLLDSWFGDDKVSNNNAQTKTNGLKTVVIDGIKYYQTPVWEKIYDDDGDGENVIVKDGRKLYRHKSFTYLNDGTFFTSPQYISLYAGQTVVIRVKSENYFTCHSMYVTDMSLAFREPAWHGLWDKIAYPSNHIGFIPSDFRTQDLLYQRFQQEPILYRYEFDSGFLQTTFVSIDIYSNRKKRREK